MTAFELITSANSLKKSSTLTFLVELTGVEPVSKNCLPFGHLQFSAAVYKTTECTARKTSVESDRSVFEIPVQSFRFTLSDFFTQPLQFGSC